MTEQGKSRAENDRQEQTTIQCLQRALDETQQTIRAYDTKAEVLAIVLTLVIGVINFSAVADKCKINPCLKYPLFIPILLGFITLIPTGMVLFPRSNPFKGVDPGNEKPNGTYYVLTGLTSSFKSLDDYVHELDATDWKRELAYEVLKTSCIRDHKHYWFHWAIRSAALTLFAIVILVIGILFYG